MYHTQARRGVQSAITLKALVNVVDAQVVLRDGCAMTPPPASLPDIDAMMDLVARFETACDSDTALANAEMDELLRHVPGKRAVLSGKWQGRPVVFRLFLQPDSPAPQRNWDEMVRVWPQMHSAPHCIAEPLHFSPEHQLLVMSYAPGTPLMQHIWQSDPGTREQWLAPAARWLRAYAQGSEFEVRARAGVWFERAEKAAATQPHRNLARLEASVLEQLRRLLPAFEQPWRNAITHGDFHPNNLLLEGTCLTGIDVGGSAAIPIYKDMARFLMHMGRRGLIPSGQTRFGVDANGIDAFAASFELNAHERDLVLPFMLGCEALLRVEHKGIKRGRVRRAVDMTEKLLADLVQI
ncbi:MAG: phosphotransferase family protein [Roseovarius sp.]